MPDTHRCPKCRQKFESEFFINQHYRYSPECAPPVSPEPDPAEVAAKTLEAEIGRLYWSRRLSMRTVAKKTGVSRLRVRTILAKLGYVPVAR
jgi:predicted DNA-binding protein (UPF0251 family)